ncbi:MAG: GNAT family N-acetyltransferase [Deltaproteobacteria bacterium]|nr:GNAT family N-acetyltransferase [Deltaproteobacteria bacterium]
MSDANVKNKLGEFKYITFGQIDKLEQLHPLVQASIPGEKFQRLVECPDVSEDFPCFFYIADDQRIYSHLSAIPDSLTADRTVYRWAWTGDLVTDPVYRGRGLAKRVVEETIKVLHQEGFIAGGGFATEVTIHIYRKLGFALPGFVTRQLLLKTIRPFLEYHLKSKPIRVLIDLLYRALFRLVRPILRIRARPKKLKVSLNEVNLYDDAKATIDVPELCYGARYHFNDSIAKLRWKFDWTKHDTRLYLLIDETTKKPLSYIVIREKKVLEPILGRYANFQLMTLMDFGFYNDDAEVYKALVQSVIGLFWKSKADILEIISSSDALNACTNRIGMRKAGKGVPFMFSVSSKWNLGERSEDISNWHLTHYSGEGFLMQ